MTLGLICENLSNTPCGVGGVGEWEGIEEEGGVGKEWDWGREWEWRRREYTIRYA